MADVGFRFIRDRVYEMEKFGEDLISIIIPVYNSAGTLRRCMDSIVNQTYGRLEIILVESASVDGSAALCDAYAKQDKRVKVIHQQERKKILISANPPRKADEQNKAEQIQQKALQQSKNLFLLKQSDWKQKDHRSQSLPCLQVNIHA